MYISVCVTLLIHVLWELQVHACYACTCSVTPPPCYLSVPVLFYVLSFILLNIKQAVGLWSYLDDSIYVGFLFNHMIKY